MFKSPESKGLLWTIIFKTEDVNLDGKLEDRTSWKKEHVKAINELRTLLSSSIEILLEGNEEWEPLAVGTQYVGIKGERFTDKDLELTKEMKKAIRFYWAIREEVPTFTTEAIDEMEKCIGSI